MRNYEGWVSSPFYFMAGYSSAPLIKKLGIKSGMKISILNPPEDFWKEFGEMPEVKAVSKPTKEMDFNRYE